ncbi:hypothetical protein PRIPAC_74576 [Pristionchus pacificus]|uniref:Uncharacterized protein n=1 Tax=Pristionchus pacificus TaxID=54126 RepID=A0A2A6C549_PRIPA|nr:hypothetical protein PRIPAC_74576 [Pristionchus pacificus]|eukprot:PDM73228.1 hypothetical protein PRIPAC_40584 [Pristionchus pacificus]
MKKNMMRRSLGGPIMKSPRRSFTISLAPGSRLLHSFRNIKHSVRLVPHSPFPSSPPRERGNRKRLDVGRHKIRLSQKKEHQRKEHGNRQRRYVKLIDDFERDLAEEGMSLDDSEEEVDLERPLDEDDLIITSDEIYDLVHSNMEFFDNPSEPVFSDFGEFEQ